MITISPPRTQKTRVTIKNASNPFGKHIYQPFISESLYQNTTPSPQTKTNIYQENNNTIAAPISSRSRKCNPHKKTSAFQVGKGGGTEMKGRSGALASYQVCNEYAEGGSKPNDVFFDNVLLCLEHLTHKHGRRMLRPVSRTTGS